MVSHTWSRTEETQRQPHLINMEETTVTLTLAPHKEKQQ
jgi:hypothetical protein